MDGAKVHAVWRVHHTPDVHLHVVSDLLFVIPYTMHQELGRSLGTRVAGNKAGSSEAIRSYCNYSNRTVENFKSLAKSASWFLLLRFLSLNWIHSKIISGATFHIIGLTKIPKIEFLLLDWITVLF